MDRFLGVTSAYSADAATTTDGDELTEDDIFWTAADFTEQNHHHQPPPTAAAANFHNRRPSFSNSSGILAALTEANRYQILSRKAAAPYSSPGVKVGAAIPRAAAAQEREYNSKKFQQSAPVKVPVLSMAVARERNKKFMEVDYYDEEGGGEEMLPPHEMVARGSPKTTFSVLEGVGRTLKGRDLRQVRNAIWRKTGFLD